MRFEPGFGFFQTYFKRKKYIGNKKSYVIRIHFVLTFPAPCISESYIEIKINLNFYFHISFGIGKGRVNK